MGEYRLAPEFEMFSVSPVVWSQKTPEQQQEHVRKALDEVRILPSVLQAKITKRLSVTVDESRITSVDSGMLNQIWQEAEEVLSLHEIVDLGEGVYCVTEYRKSVNVVVKGGSHTYRCRQSQSTVGIRRHILVVLDTIGNLPEFLKLYGQKQMARKTTCKYSKESWGKVKGKKRREKARTMLSVSPL